MTTPFDVKDLEADLLAKGLPAIENLAELAANSVFKWLQDSLTLEAAKNPLYAIAVPVLLALEPMAIKEIQKISPPPPAA